MVITCWNGRKLLEENLPGVIKASENPQNKICEILVVDDGSADDSVVFLKQNYPKIRAVRHAKNFGYSEVCNTGVRESRGELVAILNLDVVPENDFLKEVLPYFTDEKLFAVTFNEGKYGPGRLEWKNGFLEIIPSDIPLKTSETDWPNGGSSVFKKEIWNNLGGMDKLFLPFYFEDVDLGIRARKKEFKCLWEPKAKITHEHEATINTGSFKKSYLESIKERNHLLLTWKNIDSFQKLFFHLFCLAKKCFFHPGFLKIVVLAVRRQIAFFLFH